MLAAAPASSALRGATFQRAPGSGCRSTRTSSRSRAGVPSWCTTTSQHAHGRHRFGGPRVVARGLSAHDEHVLDRAADATREDAATYAPSVSYDGARVDLSASAPAMRADARTSATFVRGSHYSPRAPTDRPARCRGHRFSGRHCLETDRSWRSRRERRISAQRRPAGVRARSFSGRCMPGAPSWPAKEPATPVSPSISYDGRVIAFVAAERGAARIAIRDLSTGCPDARRATARLGSCAVGGRTHRRFRRRQAPRGLRRGRRDRCRQAHQPARPLGRRADLGRRSSCGLCR